MDAVQTYVDRIAEQIAKIGATQREAIGAAADRIVTAHADGKGVYVFGPGVHSFMGVEELFYRSGGLAFIRPIGEPGFTLLTGALHATALERTVGLAPSILRAYGVGEDDVLIINNAYGINCACIDAALYCRENRVRSIGVTSSEHARGLPKDHPARHPTGGNLFELVDLYVDTFVPVGDGVVKFGEGEAAFQAGPCSTLGMATAMNCIVCAAIELMMERGMEPEVWKSGNAPGGDTFNKRHIQRYGNTIKHLR